MEGRRDNNQLFEINNIKKSQSIMILANLLCFFSKIAVCFFKTNM